MDVFRRSSVVAAGSVLFVLLLTANTALAQGKEGANQPAFREIDLDLTQGIANQTLPFDVPFILRGEVPNTVVEVRAFLVLPTAAPQPAGGAQPIAGINCDGIVWSEFNPVARWAPPPPSALAPTPTGSTTATTSTTTNATRVPFKLLMPPLEVNTIYCTHFELERRVTPKEADEFRARAATAIGDVLGRVPVADREISNARLEELRQRLIAAITATNSGIRAQRGSMFDPRPADAMSEEDLRSAQGDLAKHLVLVLTPQFQRNLQLNRYGELVQKTYEALARVREDAPFLKDESRITAITNQLKTPGDAERFQQLLAGPSPALFALVTGLAPAQVNTPPAELVNSIWTIDSTTPTCSVKAIEAIRENLRSSRAFFDRLIEAVKPDAIATLPALASNITAAELSLRNVPDLMCRRALAISAMATNLRTEVIDDVNLLITTTGDFAARHPWHFSADVGLAVAPVIGEVFPYVGVNMYFRPVNRDARLASLRERGVNTFSRRFSVLIGYTWTDNLLKDNQRLGIFTRDNAVGLTVAEKPADSMLVVGAGIRVNDVLRINGGTLLFKAPDPNPLISDVNLEVTPFISMSFDWDAVANIRGLGGLMGLGGTPVPVAIGKRDPPPPQPAPAQPASPPQQ